jgi:uncharacterized protein with HEPN domain
MKPRREITDYLRDILDAIQKIERFIGGWTLRNSRAMRRPSLR